MSVTLIIIVVTVIISVAAWNNYSLMDRWIMNPYQVASRGQYYRLLTSGSAAPYVRRGRRAGGHPDDRLIRLS